MNKGRWKPWGHYGLYSSVREMAINLTNGFMEAHRVSDRLVLKWGEGTMSIKNVLSMAVGWASNYVYLRAGRGAAHGQKSKLYWITLIKDGNKPIEQTRLD